MKKSRLVTYGCCLLIAGSILPGNAKNHCKQLRFKDLSGLINAINGGHQSVKPGAWEFDYNHIPWVGLRSELQELLPSKKGGTVKNIKFQRAEEENGYIFCVYTLHKYSGYRNPANFPVEFEMAYEKGL